jgi:outer membrane protein
MRNLKKNVNRFLLPLITGVACTLSLQTQSADLMQIYQQAKDSDPEYRRADFDHQASRELLTQANSGYRPDINLAYDISDTNQEILSSENPLFTTGSTSFPTEIITLSLTQPVFRYANYVRIKQAESELKQADAQYANLQQALMLRTAENYINALAAENSLSFLKAERNAIEKQLELAAAKERAKLGRTADRLEAEARLASVNADYSEAEIDYLDAIEALAEMTGEQPDELSPLNEDFAMAAPEPASVEHWVDAALKHNWELEAQRQSLEVSRKEVKRQRAGHYPTVDLKFEDTIKDTGGTLFGGGSKVETQEIMLSLNVPLYQGGATSSKTREAAFKHESNKENLVRLSRKVKRETQRTFGSILNAIDRSNALQKEVAAQQEVLKLKRAGYRAALNTNLAVLDAERDLYSAKRDYIQARYDYLLNSLKLKGIVGTLSVEDLQQLNSRLEPQG